MSGNIFLEYLVHCKNEYKGLFLIKSEIKELDRITQINCDEIERLTKILFGKEEELSRLKRMQQLRKVDDRSRLEAVERSSSDIESQKQYIHGLIEEIQAISQRRMHYQVEIGYLHKKLEHLRLRTKSLASIRDTSQSKFLKGLEIVVNNDCLLEQALMSGNILHLLQMLIFLKLISLEHKQIELRLYLKLSRIF